MAQRNYRLTQRVLIQRLNRKLKEHDPLLRKTRSGSRAYLSDYFIVDSSLSTIGEKNLDAVDLQSMAMAKRVLAQWETLKLEGR